MSPKTLMGSTKGLPTLTDMLGGTSTKPTRRSSVKVVVDRNENPPEELRGKRGEAVIAGSTEVSSIVEAG